MTDARAHRIHATPFATVYRLYLAKVARKGRTQAELDAVIGWFTGYDLDQLAHHLAAETPFGDFFAAAQLHPNAAQVTGVVCGVRVEAVEDPRMRTIRRLDKLVDELAKGRPLAKVLRA
jgi:hypothetical protein